MNDQENYGGPCYNSAGTSKITCPAMPSYTPTPSCPSGQWWDTATSTCKTSTTGSGCGTYVTQATCTAQTGCSWVQGSSTTSSYCYSSGTYSPSPGTTYTYTPYPSCPSGQWWDYTINSCKSTTTSDTPYPTATTYSPYPTSTYTYTPPPSCPSDQYWNGTSCVSNVTYTPYPTTTYTPPPTCASNQYWDSATNSCMTMPTTTTTTCASDQYWDSATSTCKSFTTPTSGAYPLYMVAHCQQLGRTWNGKMCQANGLFVRFFEGSGMANVLRLFYVIP